MDYQGNLRPINHAKLVGEIAKHLESFIEVRPSSPELRATHRLYVQEMGSITIDPAFEGYKVGPGGIELRHIHIAGLQQVSLGSWQPHLIYSG
jgi:hypothetical protein